MSTYDDIEIRRPELARSYLGLLSGQPGRPIALFAPRRVGKTHFLARDLAAAAREMNWLPVYADLWLHRQNPIEAINHALEEALDDVNVPVSRLKRVAKTQVKKIGGLGASVDFGDEPQRRKLPEKAELRLDALVGRLAGDAKQPVLLMLDEIQSLAEAPGGDLVIGALRAVLQRRRGVVHAVFTGSSQEALAAMMVSTGGPMYQFAQLMTFPVLGRDYLERLAKHFRRVHPTKQLDIDALERVFARIGHKPQLMKDIVKEMSAEGITDCALGLKRFTEDERQIAGWRGLLDQLSPLEVAVLDQVAKGEPPMAKDSIVALSKVLDTTITLAKARLATEKLRRAGILMKGANGYVVDDPLFVDYLQARKALPRK